MFQQSFQNNNNQSFPMGGNGSGARTTNNNGGSFSHKAPVMATDLRCYFECPEAFKKDYDLRIHIKLKHRNEGEEELRRAYQAAEEEIALTKRSASMFQCALCPKSLTDYGSFHGHVRKVHKTEWADYVDKYGRCEVESAPFQCNICNRIVKYSGHRVDVHLKNVHDISWADYIDRIRRLRRGEAPKELPQTQYFSCKVCNAQVKFIFRKDHLKSAHKITEFEYVELYKDDLTEGEMKEEVIPNAVEAQEDRKEEYVEMRETPQNFKPSKPNYFGSESFSSNDDLPLFDQPEESTKNNVFPRQSQPCYNPPTPILERPANQSLPKPPKSDIQDRTNKNCSSCMMQFDSRKNFIEHCTTIHLMKFKTKSGATISASTTLSQLQPSNQSFKREFEDDGGNERYPGRNNFTNQMPLRQDPSSFRGISNPSISRSDMSNDENGFIDNQGDSE